jgi:hypothetical protein
METPGRVPHYLRNGAEISGGINDSKAFPLKKAPVTGVAGVALATLFEGGQRRGRTDASWGPSGNGGSAAWALGGPSHG